MSTTKAKKGLFLFLVIVSLFGLINQTGIGVNNVKTPPIPVQRPQGIILQQIHNGFLRLIRDMQSAGFDPNNVFYSVYDSTGSYTYPVISQQEREVTIDLTGLTLLLNKTIERLEAEGIDTGDLNYLKNIYAELLLHDEVEIYHKVDSDLSVTSNHDRKAVTIFYDNDRSVIDSLDTIKNNKTINKQPFSGDEILTNVFLSLIKDRIHGTYEVNNTWDYEDGSNADLLKNFIRRITDNRWLWSELRVLFKLPAINIMRTMTQNTKSWATAESDPRVIEYGRFQISQLIIDKLELRKVDKKLKISEFDYKYIEHHFLGNLVYNDTNSNGMMDIGVKTIPVGQNDITYPSIGDEALFRFDIKQIEKRNYQSPQTTNNVLEFGSEFENVVGYLQPLDKKQDYSLFNVSAGQAYNVDEISTLFHFSVNNTDASANLKFDYVIGEWNNSASLDGLGFNQLMASTVIDANKKRNFSWKHNNNTELDDDFENASKISRFRLAHSEKAFCEIQLDDIPYIWDGTEEVNAVGQLIPMNIIDITYGKISSEADLIRGIKGNAERKTFLYSVSYPKWDGKSIVHDPAYSAVAAVATETADGDGGVPGFEFSVILFAIPMLVLIEAYRRKKY